ncbi:MAG: poly-gamma-glutamate system protein, partial [Pyramidobacter sp.]|nr:poly-gamma-glutamate system protein [Pyramidobacter sp.]
MKLEQFEAYKNAQRRFVLRNRIKLVSLALVLLALAVWSGGGASRRELSLMERVRTAQNVLYEWRVAGGSEFDPSDDPYRTGLVGLEWSELSTTVGSLEAKRTACDPRWSVVIRRWMESLKVTEGDSVAIFTSSSFPGMALNAVAALESL